MNRYDLMTAGVVGAGLPGPGSSASGEDSVNGPGSLEPGRKVPVAEDCQVIGGGARHEDGVCRVYFNADVQSAKKEEGTAIAGTCAHAKSHDVPGPCLHGVMGRTQTARGGHGPSFSTRC